MQDTNEAYTATNRRPWWKEECAEAHKAARLPRRGDQDERLLGKPSGLWCAESRGFFGGNRSMRFRTTRDLQDRDATGGARASAASIYSTRSSADLHRPPFPPPPCAIASRSFFQAHPISSRQQRTPPQNRQRPEVSPPAAPFHLFAPALTG